MDTTIVIGEREQVVMLARGDADLPSYLPRGSVQGSPHDVMVALSRQGYTTLRQLDGKVLVGVSEVSVTEDTLRVVTRLARTQLSSLRTR